MNARVARTGPRQITGQGYIRPARAHLVGYGLFGRLFSESHPCCRAFYVVGSRSGLIVAAFPRYSEQRSVQRTYIR